MKRDTTPNRTRLQHHQRLSWVQSKSQWEKSQFTNEMEIAYLLNFKISYRQNEYLNQAIVSVACWIIEKGQSIIKYKVCNQQAQLLKTGKGKCHRCGKDVLFFVSVTGNVQRNSSDLSFLARKNIFISGHNKLIFIPGTQATMDEEKKKNQEFWQCGKKLDKCMYVWNCAPIFPQGMNKKVGPHSLQGITSFVLNSCLLSHRANIS